MVRPHVAVFEGDVEVCSEGHKGSGQPIEDHEDVIIQHHQVVVEKKPLYMKLKGPPRCNRCKLSFGF